MKRSLPVLAFVALAALFFGYLATRPRPPDLRLRAERDGVEPFDSEALYRLLPGLLGAPVEPVEVTPFERLADTTLVATAYVFVAGAFEPGPADTDRLLAYAARGNTLVVAAESVGWPLAGALGDTTGVGDDVNDGGADRVGDKTGDDSSEEPGGLGLEVLPSGDFWTEVVSPLGSGDTLRVGRRDYAFPVLLGGVTLGGLDSARTAVVATDTRGRAVAVAVAVGRGRAVVLATPLALTNAAVAGEGDGAAFLAAVFAYVPPVRRVLWDETFKPLRQDGGSLFRVAARSPALRGALAVVFLGTLLGVANAGRRRQRPIPVRQPPPNAQRDFARTIGRLFFVRDERRWLARRKIRVFEDGLRTRLGLADADLSDQTARRAAARAGVPEADAQALFARLRDLDTDPAPDAAVLLALDRDADALLNARDVAR